MESKFLEEYEAIIGLEVHAQLQTESKMFCGCSTAYGSPPNTNTCPVCLGMPGALPVVNRQAVSFAIRAALATGCRIHQRSIWDRKNYFYPDLPKGYQITQYRHPLAEGGRVLIDTPEGEREIRITRIHLEEDAGKSIHVEGADRSLLDFNRCGVPLVEVVSGPDIHTPEEGVAVMKSLRAILMALGVCDGNLEQGSFRCDANLSLRPRGATALGTKTEIKNLNSFRFLQRALGHEIVRQAKLLKAGEQVIPETRSFESRSGVTRPMRSKEEVHDYRYFPDPDLPPLEVDWAWIQAERAAVRAYRAPKKIANQAVNQLPRERGAREPAAMKKPPLTPRQVVEERGYQQLMKAVELEALVREVIGSHPAEVEKYCRGKKGLLGFFVGQVVKVAGGKADPRLVNRLVRKMLG